MKVMENGKYRWSLRGDGQLLLTHASALQYSNLQSVYLELVRKKGLLPIVNWLKQINGTLANIISFEIII